MLTRGLRVDVESNLPSCQTVTFNKNVWLTLVCLNASLDTLHQKSYVALETFCSTHCFEFGARRPGGVPFSFPRA